MNKAFLTGNLTRDPELRTTSGGIAVCSFSIAINRRFKNAAGEQETDFINVTAWRQLGELCAKYLAKGRKVCVVGAIQTRTYEAQDGSKRNAFEVVADEVEFLSPIQQGQTHRTAPAQEPGGFNAEQQGFTQVDDSDDELPF